jgi:hypothetical protein
MEALREPRAANRPSASAPELIRTRAEVAQYVHFRLCERENLLEDQSPLVAQPLRLGERICGWHYEVRGPRNVRLTAIWSSDQRMLYLYDAAGQRFEKKPLPDVRDADSP